MPVREDERDNGAGIEDGQQCVPKKNIDDKRNNVRERDKDKDDEDENINRVHVYMSARDREMTKTTTTRSII